MSKKNQTVDIFLNNFPISQYFVLKFDGRVVHFIRNHFSKFQYDWYRYDGEIFILMEAILFNSKSTGILDV